MFSKERVNTLMKHDNIDAVVGIPDQLIPQSESNRSHNAKKGAKFIASVP